MGKNTDKGNATSKVTLDKFPIAIDTTSQIISVRVITNQHDPDNPKAVWWHLNRINPSTVNHSIPTSNDRVHFFCDGQLFEGSCLTVAYDAVGAISGVWQLDRGYWHETYLAEEYTGQVPSSPSIRFQFANDKDREEFIVNFRKLSKDVADSKPPVTKNVLAMLRAVGRSNVPPRVVPTVTSPTVLGSES